MTSPAPNLINPKPIVAAAVLDSLENPTQLLVASRAYPEELYGRFELPGGKIEDGESPEDALVREIHEEIGADIHLGQEITGPDGEWWTISFGRRMGVWLAELTPESPAPQRTEVHLELRWVPLEDALSVDWISHDRPIVQKIQEMIGTSENNGVS